MPIHDGEGIKKNTEFKTKVKADLVFEQLLCLLQGCKTLPGIIESTVVVDKENWRITFSSKGEGKSEVEEDEESGVKAESSEQCHHAQTNINIQLSKFKDHEGELCVEFTHGRKVSEKKNFWKGGEGSSKTIFFEVYKQIV